MGSAAKASRSSARVWILRRVAATLTAATLFLACQPAPPVATSRPTSGTQPSSTLATSSAEPTPSFHATSDGVAPQGPTQQATVTRITDGDTIRVEFGGTEYRLRYIGMDAPESVDPSRPDQPGGHEATLANTALVAGKTVYLERDVSETDRFDRLLRYVWLQTDTGLLMANRELVLEGWARSKAYPPDTKYQDVLDEAQRQAQAARVGIWALQAAPTPVPLVGGPQCDAAYPGVCIPPPPPDLDCGDITYRRFTVLPPDPHRFDGDGNGIGCEQDSP